MTHEAQLHSENSFLTLTYAPEFLPAHSSLNYSHTQKFIDKLRAALSYSNYDRKIKYYLAGEYGENFSRPHYHAIIFGFDFTSPLFYKGKDNHQTKEYSKNGNIYREYSFLDDLWGLGQANVGDVNYSTCRYTAGYITKKINGKLAKDHYGPREREKAFISNGIGRQWLETFWSDVYPEDHCVLDAKKLKTPKYYDKWLEKNDPSLFEQVKIARENSMIAKDVDHQELARVHEVKIRNQQMYSNDLKGAAPVNELDWKIIDYNKRQSDAYHQRKKNAKNVHGLRL